jgi:hypothetical protein
VRGIASNAHLRDPLRQLPESGLNHREIAHPCRHVAVPELVVNDQPLLLPVADDRLVGAAVLVGDQRFLLVAGMDRRVEIERRHGDGPAPLNLGQEMRVDSSKPF